MADSVINFSATGYRFFDWALLTLSLSNVILLLWLGLTVLLNAEARTGGVWLVGCALLLGSLFFMAHTALLGSHLDLTDLRLNFWWRAGWLPLVALPYAWYAIMLWYRRIGSSAPANPVLNSPPAPRKRPLGAFLIPHPTVHLVGFGTITLLFVFLLLLLGFTSLLPTFRQTVTLDFSTVLRVAGMPLLLLLYPLYIILCSAFALASLLPPLPLPHNQQNEARRRARPWLIAATVDLLLVSLLVGALIVWIFALTRQLILGSDISHISTRGFLNLMVAGVDLTIAALLLLATILIGQAIVSYAIFSGRVLPRADLRRYWRNVLILGTGFSGLASGNLVLMLSPIYLLLLTAGLITLCYALLGWRTFHHHDELMRQLRPFVRSQHLYEQVMATAPLDDEANRTFQTLCQQVLQTDYAALTAVGALAPLFQPPWVWPSAAPLPDNLAEIAQPFTTSQTLALGLPPDVTVPARYAVPLWSERGLRGLLLLGYKQDGGLYTQEELAVAQAMGERLIDTRASGEIARRLFTLQRQRLAESQLLDRQIRRTLHDEILPQLHTALLTLSQADATLKPVQTQLATVHRQIANLLRQQQPTTPPLLAQGLLPALQRLFDEEVWGMFDGISYQVEERASVVAAGLTDPECEVLYYAVREVVRNAARHGRGGVEQRPLHLQVNLTVDESGRGLRFMVADDGVGLAAPTLLEQGRGLTLHRTLLAILGATFEGQNRPNGGLLVQIAWRR